MNGSHIRGISLDDLFDRTKSYWPEQSNQKNDDYKKSVLGLIQERLKYFAEIPELTTFFFEDLPINLELITSNKQLKKLENQQLKTYLQEALEVLTDSDFSVDNLSDTLNKLLETTGEKPGILFSLIRIATTWAPASPGLADTLCVLGKETTLRRIRASISSI